MSEIDTSTVDQSIVDQKEQQVQASLVADKETVAGVLPVLADERTSEIQEAGAIEKTGDAIIDESVALLVATDNLTMADINRAIGVAIERQDPTLIDKAFIEERFKDKSNYVKALAERYITSSLEKVNQTNEQIFSLVGGEANWSVVRDAFIDGAPTHLMQAAKALVASGDELTAAKLMIDYATSTGLGPNQKAPIKGGAPVGVKPLTESEFKTAIKELQAEAGLRQSLDSPKFRDKYTQLINARKSGKILGI